jgi:heme/copper-type cytochrome/quinol oxidase subunit 3
MVRRILLSLLAGLLIQILFIIAGVPLLSAVISSYVLGPPNAAGALKVLVLVITNILLLSSFIHVALLAFRRFKRRNPRG